MMRREKDTRFKMARINAGLKQHELARLTGASEALISRIETGRAGSIDNDLRNRIAHALNCKPWEIGI